MALLFMDSFDHYATADLPFKWATGGTVSINTTNGRRSSQSYRASPSAAFIAKSFTVSGLTSIVGFGLKASALISNGYIVGIYNGTNVHTILGINADGSLTAYRTSGNSFPPTAGIGVTVLGNTVSGVITVNTYAYIEMKTLTSDTVGTIIVKINGNIVLNLSSLDTANTTTIWSGVWLGAIGGTGTVNDDFDDLYICDGSGSAPWNDFLGDCRVDARYPTAAGATTGWTPSTGSNWQNVDDAAPNGDTDYNSAAGVVTDTFVTQDSPVAGSTIYGIQHNLLVKKLDAGIGTIAPVVRHSGTDNVGTGLGIGTSYGFVTQINQTNPGTGAAWVEADFNAAEFGYKRLT